LVIFAVFLFLFSWFPEFLKSFSLTSSNDLLSPYPLCIPLSPFLFFCFKRIRRRA
jgi:hypothetical protein